MVIDITSFSVEYQVHTVKIKKRIGTLIMTAVIVLKMVRFGFTRE